MKAPNLAVWLLAAVLLVIAGYAVSVLPLAEWAQALSSWFEALGAAGFLAFAGAYVVAAVLLIPVWPLSITAGVVFGTLGFILVPVSATLGAAAAFVLSRHFARGNIRDWLARRPHYRAVDQAIAEEGWKVVALLRLSPLVPYNLMNYFCGMTGVTFPIYLLATFLGSVPVTAMYVYLGLVGQAVARGTMGWPQWALLLAGLAATIAVTVLITRRVRLKLRLADDGSTTDAEMEPANRSR